MKRSTDSIEDRVLYILIYTLLILFSLIILYPLIFILSSSFSAPSEVIAGRVVLWPVKPGIQGYKAVFSHRMILTGYRNTVFYTAVGTAINIFMTAICAYPLSRHDFPARKFFMFLFTFTMFFGGGLIPTYILMVQLDLVNKIWAMLIPGAMGVFNVILTRTFFMSNIPNDLLEASQIDGCSDLRFFFSILMPLSKAILAVITLYYAVGHWNSYFGALIYLNDPNLYPLQIVLRNILIMNQVNLTDIIDVDLIVAKRGMADLLKYALIVVSSAPIIALYPFVQRYFIKGVMIGSLKG